MKPKRLALVPAVVAAGDDVDARGEELVQIFSVMPKPPAAFSPLTITKSMASRRRRPGSCSRTARRPLRPTMSPQNSSRMLRIAGYRMASLGHDPIETWWHRTAPLGSSWPA